MTQHELLKRYILCVARGYGNSLIVVSKAGLGKTELTMDTLAELNFEEGKHYIYVPNYITPVELYLLLENVNKLQDPKILVLDDVEDTLNNKTTIGLLKGALWAVNERRRVSWRSGTHKITKKEFDFEGRIIFLLNQLHTKSPVVNALKDRGFYFVMDLTLQDMFKLMKERAEVPHEGIPLNKRREIVDYLVNVGRNTKNISLRTLPKAFQMFQISPNHWQELLKQEIV